MPTVGLDKAAEQRDWSAGMFRGVREDLIPANGAYDITNGLLDNTGSVYRRGGTSYITDERFSTATWLPMIWDGYLAAGQRTVIASTAQFGIVSGSTTTVLGASGLPSPGRPAAFMGTLYFPDGQTYNGTALGTSPKVGSYYAVAGNRLFVAEGDTISFSDIGTGGVGTTTFAATDYHQVPEGVRVIGLEGLRNALVAFTTGGVWVYSNIGVDLTDAAGNVQHRVDRYSRDLILWGDAGIAGWEGGLVVPALDDVWLMALGVASEAPSPFVRISEPITALYRSYVNAGYRPGQACVYRGHYFLPILNGETVVDMLVCRIDRQGRPWTHLTGMGAKVPAMTVRTTTAVPVLVGTSETTGHVMNLSYFEPSMLVARDADQTSHICRIQFRDFATGPLNKNTICKVRIGYDLGAMGAGPPPVAVDTIWGAFNWGTTDWGTTAEDLQFEGEPGISLTELLGDPPAGQPSWGTFNWGSTDWGLTSDTDMLSPDAPPDEFGLEPHTWHMAKRRRFGRFQLELTRAASHMTLRWMEMYVRSTGRL
jgi:hypothetical protein